MRLLCLTFVIDISLSLTNSFPFWHFPTVTLTQGYRENVVFLRLRDISHISPKNKLTIRSQTTQGELVNRRKASMVGVIRHNHLCYYFWQTDRSPHRVRSTLHVLLDPTRSSPSTLKQWRFYESDLIITVSMKMAHFADCVIAETAVSGGFEIFYTFMKGH